MISLPPPPYTPRPTDSSMRKYPQEETTGTVLIDTYPCGCVVASVSEQIIRVCEKHRKRGDES